MYEDERLHIKRRKV